MLYCFDGSGFSATPCVPYGWQRTGEARQIPCRRGKRMDVPGFLICGNDLFCHAAERPVTTDTVVKTFDAFVERVAGKHGTTKVPCFVVLDNASAYSSRAFKEKLADWQQSGVRVYFLPPYSPEP